MHPHQASSNQQASRIEICKQCIFVACDFSKINKCDINTLVCTKDNNKNIIEKTSNPAETCPMGFWEIANATHTTHVQSSGKSCGCGK